MTTVENNNNILRGNIFSGLGYDSEDEKREEISELDQIAVLEPLSVQDPDSIVEDVAVVEKEPAESVYTHYTHTGSALQLDVKADGKFQMTLASRYDTIPSTIEIENGLRTEKSRFSFKTTRSEVEIRDSLKRDFPSSAFSVFVRQDADPRLTAASIARKLLPEAEKVKEWLTAAKGNGRNFVEMITSCSDDAVKQWFADNWSDADFGFRTRVLTDRLSSIRLFDKAAAKTDEKTGEPTQRRQLNSLPSKAKLEEFFSRSKTPVGKSPVAHLIVRRELVNEKTRIVHGYKFMFSKSQPADLDLVSITVFQQDDKSKDSSKKSNETKAAQAAKADTA